MLYVHVGPGRLGLGLVVQQLIEAQQLSNGSVSICLVGRPDGPLPELREFAISYTDPNRGLVPQEVRWVTTEALVGSLQPDLLSAIETEETVLITAAMGSHIGDREEWIVDLVKHRPTGAETILIACENDPDPSYGRISASCGSALVTLLCVVDRICSWPPTGRHDSLGRRIVVVHPVGEWVIEPSKKPSPALESIARASLVELASGPIEGFRARKLWAVNGVHIVLALIARQADVDALPLAEPYGSQFQAVAEPLMRAISSGLSRRWPLAPAGADYVKDRIQAFLEAPDTTDRLLKSHLLRSDLRGFMRRLDARLGEAARAAQESGIDTEPFFAVMALVVEVLSDLSLYYATELGVSLDSALDAEALDLFELALSGWLDPSRARDLHEALQRSLQDHHARMG